MTPKAARQKGARWEKEVARLLGEWYYKDPTSLYRTAGSGTLHGRADQVGDIGVARSGLGPFVFSVECKHVEKWDIGDVLTRGESSLLISFWKQCRRSAGGGKIPLLLLKQNHKPVLAGLQRQDHMQVVNSKSRIDIRGYDLTLFLLAGLFRTNPRDWVARWGRL